MQMGIGPLGAPNTIIKRRNRWTMAISTPCGTLPAWACKTAGRPNLDIEELELNFLNATTWVPGKAKWQPINVTYYDVASSDFQGLFNWMATVYNFQDEINLKMSEKSGWAGVALLQMYDGCGALLESWQLGSVFPTSINFGELNYDTGEFCTIDLTLRYSEVKYRGNCNNITPQGCCNGC
jgi:hypothetical protein